MIVGEFLNAVPADAEGLPDELTMFPYRDEYVLPEGRRLRVTKASLPDAPPGSCAFLLDLDLTWARAEPSDVDSAMQQVDVLRDDERRAFEALITDRSRELFDGEP